MYRSDNTRHASWYHLFSPWSKKNPTSGRTPYVWFGIYPFAVMASFKFFEGGDGFFPSDLDFKGMVRIIATNITESQNIIVQALSML
jgi:hypothetical protein